MSSPIGPRGPPRGRRRAYHSSRTIAFAIPSDEWWLHDDRAILWFEDGVFLLTDDVPTVDFSTRTDVTGGTNPDGTEVGIEGLEPNAWGVAAIWVLGDGCTIIGLDRVLQRGDGVMLEGHDDRVLGCTISGPLHAGVYVNGTVGIHRWRQRVDL